MSAYATPNDVRLAANPDWRPIDGSDTSPDTASQDVSTLSDLQLSDAIGQASARVDSYIGARYQTPVAPVDGSDPAAYPDPQITYWTRDIALYLATLTWQRGVLLEPTDPVSLRYQSAMLDLTSVRDGKTVLNLPPAIDGDAAAAAGGWAGVVDPGTVGVFDAADAGYHRGQHGIGVRWVPRPWETGERVAWR